MNDIPNSHADRFQRMFNDLFKKRIDQLATPVEVTRSSDQSPANRMQQFREIRYHNQLSKQATSARQGVKSSIRESSV